MIVYNAVFHKDDKGVIHFHFPDLVSVDGHGSTWEQAYFEAVKTLSLMVKDLDELPIGRTKEDLMFMICNGDICPVPIDHTI